MATGSANPLMRLLGWLERLISRPLGLVVVFGAGLAVYAVRAIAWPLRPGRDLDEYLYAWIQLFDHDVLLPWSMLFRTPVTPVVAGALRWTSSAVLSPSRCAPCSSRSRSSPGARRH